MEDRRKVLIIGGGPAGMEAAYCLACFGYQVLLVEREKYLGGRLLHLDRLYTSMEEAAVLLEALKARVNASPLIETCLETIPENIQKVNDVFEVTLSRESKSCVEKVGAVILATGAAYFDTEKCAEYGYGRYDGVLNSLDFEKLLQSARAGRGPFSAAGKLPQRVAFFQCVGSRKRAGAGSQGWPYCSKICCMYTAKQARQLRELLPDSECYVFYMDVRAAGREYEEFLRETMEKNRVRYVRGRPAKVFPNEGGLLIRAEDTLIGCPIELEVDLVVLAAALEPSSETVELARMLQLPTDAYGFLRSCSGTELLKAGEGVFFAGACEFPKGIEESRIQGQAAARSAASYLNARGSV
ncbi:MAG: FAD-dependent oxidoreductase [Bacillota bacterium]|nr:FAD-dependent oxidoreductase [Bacillota bacterium]